MNRHVVVGDRSVTFRHKRNKENESWIILIYSKLKEPFPKWVWCGGLSPHRCARCYCQWFLYLLLPPVEYCSWFYDIIWYILLSILSWPMISTQYLCFILTPTCMFSLCYLWSAANMPSTSTKPQLKPDFSIIRIQGELLFLARTGFFPSRLDVLMFGHGPSLLLILAS